MHILSIVAYKHFPQDNPKALYSPEAPTAILLHKIDSGTGVVEAKAYVDQYCEPYQIRVTYGNNQPFASEQPDHWDRMLVPVKDILDIQQTHIDLDNYGAIKHDQSKTLPL